MQKNFGLKNDQKHVMDNKVGMTTKKKGGELYSEDFPFTKGLSYYSMPFKVKPPN